MRPSASPFRQASHLSTAGAGGKRGKRQKTKDKGQRTKGKGYKAKDEVRKAKGKGQKAKDEGQKAKDKGQKVKGEGCKANDKRQRAEDKGQQRTKPIGHKGFAITSITYDKKKAYTEQSLSSCVFFYP